MELTMTSAIDLNDFPNFPRGDVLITNPHGASFKLHSFNLRSNSSVLGKIIDETVPLKLTKVERAAGKTVIYKIKMVPNKNDDRFVEFVAKDRKMRELLVLSELGHHSEPPYLSIYDNLFRCLYNLDLKLTVDMPESGSITQLMNLLNAAELLETAHVVRLTIESHLVRTGHNLWMQISAQPELWANIGTRLQSPLIFREAMCHLVGKWNMPEIADKTGVESGVNKQLLKELSYGIEISDLVAFKVNELNDVKRSIESQIMSYWPPTMMHQPSADGLGPGRAEYARDIYQWQALTLIRQYVAEAIMNELNFRRFDGGTQLYRQIHGGNAAYLTRFALNAFYVSFSMTRKGQICFEDTLHAMKERFKPIVAPLLIDRTQFGSSGGRGIFALGRAANGGDENAASDNNGEDGFRFPYLTCVEVREAEMPWKLLGKNRDGRGGGERTNSGKGKRAWTAPDIDAAGENESGDEVEADSNPCKRRVTFNIPADDDTSEDKQKGKSQLFVDDDADSSSSERETEEMIDVEDKDEESSTVHMATAKNT